MPTPPLHAETASLVAALLSVNQYPIAMAYALIPAFEERGLLDPARVAAIPHADLIEAMKDAGYTRGGYVPILSFRLYKLMDALASGALAPLAGLAAAGDKARFVETLCAVEGFGPRTAETAWDLFRTAPS